MTVLSLFRGSTSKDSLQGWLISNNDEPMDGKRGNYLEIGKLLATSTCDAMGLETQG